MRDYAVTFTTTTGRTVNHATGEIIESSREGERVIIRRSFDGGETWDEEIHVRKQGFWPTVFRTIKGDVI